MLAERGKPSQPDLARWPTWRRITSLATTPVLLAGAAALGLSSASADSPLPPNACTTLLSSDRPQAQKKQLADQCVAQQNSKIIVIDLSNLPRRAEKAVASDTEELLKTSDDGLLQPQVEVIRPPKKVGKLFRRLMDQNPGSRTHNIPDPGAAGSPSELVLQADPQLASAGLIATLSPQHGIIPHSRKLDGVFGVDYEETKFATIYTNNAFVTRNPYEIALFLAHEDEHDEGIGHTSVILSHHPNATETYGLLHSSWPRISLGSKFFSLKQTGDQELGGNSIMGQWQGANADAPSLPPPALDRLEFAKSILHGKTILGERDITKEGLTLTIQEVSDGEYPMLNLKHPIPFDGSESGLIKLGKLALVPHIDKTGKISFFTLMGYDAKGTGNVALIGNIFKPPSSTEQELLLEGQTVHITYSDTRASLKVNN